MKLGIFAVFYVMASVIYADPVEYMEEIQEVKFISDFQKNQGLSGDIEKNVIEKVDTKQKKAITEYCGLVMPPNGVEMSVSFSTRQTTTYDFRNKIGKQTKDKEVEEVASGTAVPVRFGKSFFASGKSQIVIKNDNLGIVEETTKSGEFSSSVKPIFFSCIQYQITKKSVTGSSKYGYVNAEETYLQSGILTISADFESIKIDDLFHSRAIIKVLNGSAIIADVDLENCEESDFDDAIERFKNGKDIPCSTWKGNADNIMSSITTEVSMKNLKYQTCKNVDLKI